MYGSRQEQFKIASFGIMSPANAHTREPMQKLQKFSRNPIFTTKYLTASHTEAHKRTTSVRTYLCEPWMRFSRLLGGPIAACNLHKVPEADATAPSINAKYVANIFILPRIFSLLCILTYAIVMLDYFSFSFAVVKTKIVWFSRIL